MRLLRLSASLLGMAFLLTSGSCLAQSPQSAATPTGAAARRAGPPKELRHERLRAIPTDLKVPVPPDAKFEGGYRSQYAGSKLITEVRFGTRNRVDAISDWYQKSLAGSGWTVSKGHATRAGSTLSGYKAGFYCNMVFSGDSTNAQASTVLLNYTESR